jgi:zinc D-Ala-D-Ala carboxypeptidase
MVVIILWHMVGCRPSPRLCQQYPPMGGDSMSRMGDLRPYGEVMQLTPHFTLDEFTISETAARKNLINTPLAGTQERKNLQRTAEVMEKVRTTLGDKPILISSGYRSLRVNELVGGSKNSAHMSGLAVDFICPGFGTPKQICHKLHPHMRELGIDQLIHEFNTWVHLGLSGPDTDPRHMAMTIDNKGTRHGFA